MTRYHIQGFGSRKAFTELMDLDPNITYKSWSRCTKKGFPLVKKSNQDTFKKFHFNFFMMWKQKLFEQFLKKKQKLKEESTFQFFLFW